MGLKTVAAAVNDLYLISYLLVLLSYLSLLLSYSLFHDTSFFSLVPTLLLSLITWLLQASTQVLFSHRLLGPSALSSSLLPPASQLLAVSQSLRYAA